MPKLTHNGKLKLNDPTIHYPLYLYLCMHIIVSLCKIVYYNMYIAQGYVHVHYILLLFPGMFTSMDYEHGVLNIWRIWRLWISHINYMTCFGLSLNSLLGYWSFNLTCDPVSIDFSNR